MEILKRPILTEKAAALGEKASRYAFVVDTNANKIQIRTAVEAMYGVTVESVNTLVVAGKVRMRGTKSGFTVGRTNRYKKAIVTLAKGETIDFYSNI